MILNNFNFIIKHLQNIRKYLFNFNILKNCLSDRVRFSIIIASNLNEI